MRAAPLACIVLCMASAAAASDASSPARFDYFYIEANEGGSAGGHAAIRFDGDTYHFQYAPSGLLEMARVPTVDFLAEYALLSNRAIHVTRIETDAQTRSALHDAFDRRYFRQGWELRRLERLDDGRARLARGELRLPVEGAGYFDRTTAAPAVARLRRAVRERHGDDALALRARGARAALRQAARAVGPALAESVADPVAALTAIELLSAGAGLDPSRLVADDHASAVLDEDERRSLRALRGSLEARLVELFASPRPDWGTPFLVGVARLLAIDASLTAGRLVFLDAFPSEPATVVPRGEHWKRVGPELLARSQERFDAARREALARSSADEPSFDEPAFARLEAASNHLADLRGAVARGGPVRMVRGRLVPTRAAPGAALEEADRKQLAAAFRTAHDTLRASLEERADYHVIDRNCVSAIFETIDGALAGLAGSDDPDAIRAESTRRLGGRIDPGASLAFIPFVSSHAVREQYRVVDTFSVASDRQAHLAAMRRVEPDWWVHLRESNVLTSTLYTRSRDDSLFLFFTEDVPLLRPVYGALNLAVGLSGSAAGLLWSPFDRGDLLVDGLRGALASMPELFFVNIRKGSNDFVVVGPERDALVGDRRFASAPARPEAPAGAP